MFSRENISKEGSEMRKNEANIIKEEMRNLFRIEGCIWEGKDAECLPQDLLRMIDEHTEEMGFKYALKLVYENAKDAYDNCGVFDEDIDEALLVIKEHLETLYEEKEK